MGKRLLVAVVAACTSCCKGQQELFEPHRVARQDIAGSAHIAVLSVAPWEKYRDSLQPTFKLAADDALALAIPSTLALEEKFLHALAAKFRIALPTTTSTSTFTAKQTDDAKPSTSAERTTTTSSGDASKLTTGAAPEGARTAAGLPAGSPSPLAASTGTDVMLRYLAATAIYQEVQALNFYVKEAAVRDDRVAYVVRLQVTLLPLARNQPYDAYTSISLFGGPWALGSGVGEYKIAGDLVKEPKPKHFQVEAVPLLVTDDLEAALRSRSVDELRQTALALAAAFGNIGGLGNVEQTDEELRTVAGRDLNSTFTVARVNDNTVLCRFGALYQATAHYAMVPQTHNVTLLVLVPRDQAVLEPGVDRRVRLSSLTTLVDAETGEQLPGRGWNDVRRKVEAVFRDHDFPVSGAGLDVLLYRVAENNYDDFLTAALAVSGKQRLSYPESLWSDLSSIRRGSQYASASFDVPRRQTRLPAAEQSPVFADDTKSAIGVTLRGGKGLDATELSAMLSVGDVHLAATALKVVEGREVTLTFPSLKLLKLDGSKAVLELKQGAQTSAWDCAKAGCQFVEPATAAPAAKASFGMAVRVKNLRSSGDGKGKLQLVFTVAKDATPDIHFTVEGADVDEVTPAGSVIAKDDGWNLGRSATVTLALSNLSPFSPVLVNAGDGTSKASASVPVLAIDSKK